MKYTQEIKDFILQEIEHCGLCNLKRHLKHSHPTEYQNIIKLTTFVPEKDTIAHNAYCILNNIYEIPKCRVCGKDNKFKSIHEGYREICSIKYMNNDKITKDKRLNSMQKTNLERYGVKHNWSYRDENNLTSIEKYNLENFGVKNTGEIIEVKEKIKDTMLERYGVVSYTQTDEFKNNIKKNNLEKYGVEYYAQTTEFKEKCKNTCLEKYGVSSYTKTKECQDKKKQTCLEKYGVEYNFQRPEIIQNAHETQSRLINELIESNCDVDCDLKKLAKNEGIFWNLGLNETKILNQVEKNKGIKLIRQKAVASCFVDGYDAENNVCYEVDENYHRKEEQSEKDKNRERKIIDELDCTFIRIPDYTH